MRTLKLLVMCLLALTASQAARAGMATRLWYSGTGTTVASLKALPEFPLQFNTSHYYQYDDTLGSAFGELVFTSLTKEALPIIRYRTRDLTRLLPGTARTMRRMEKITGRSDDMLIIRGVNVFPTQIEELILKQPKLAPHYVLEVTRPDKLDDIAVLVEPKPEHVAMSEAARKEAASALAHVIKTFVGVSAEVKVTAIGAIERSIGKAKRVLDKRPK